jgi:hypothetical protein
MLVLGVASLSDDERAIEYRIIVNHVVGWCPCVIDNWLYTTPLIIQPVDQPFDAMSILLPGGDSVALSLQRLTRGGDSFQDEIESHYFVNHCPGDNGGGVISEDLTHHYSSTSNQGETVRQFKQRVSSPNPAK